MRHFRTLFLSTLFAGGVGTLAQAKAIKVADAAAFKAAVPQLQPGDTLVMAAGTWQDAKLVFKAEGTEKQPIVLRAEKPGAVKLQGQSNLRLAGHYLVVSGLDFRNGYAPSGCVIEFRADAQNLAFHCRVTECVIEDYNKPAREEDKDDIWVKLHGQHNRFDHNYVAGKKTGGVTMAVDLAVPESQNNYHQIDHNYFGPRPRLGSNGGETLRVGVSTYSLTASHTRIEENYFYRCSGEVEIISIKSGENAVRRNLFVECEGSVVLRHGNNNLVEGNYFLGNGKAHTGGVRIINAGHRVLDNYFADLRGTNFRGALVIMNGVPNSPLNRYNQVKDVTVSGNIFLNCDNIELCEGKDGERTATPENVVISNNIFYNLLATKQFTVNDDISGITFKDNPTLLSSSPSLPGLTATPLILQRSADGLTVPTVGKGKPKQRRPVTEAESGPRWFRPTVVPGMGTGKLWKVRAGEADALRRVCQQAQRGDIIELSSAGTYPVSQPIAVTVPLVVRAKKGLGSRPVLSFAGTETGRAFFSIENGGMLRLSGLAFDGNAPAGTADALIRTGAQPMLEHYNLWADNCTFYNLRDSGKSAFQATKSTYADTVQFSNSLFYDLGGNALSLNTELQNKGTYNAENVVLRNCLFRNVQGGALDLYRGGNDESTLGPLLTVDHCTFDNVGNAADGYVLKLTGVQWSEISQCLFNDSGRNGYAILARNADKSTATLRNTNFSRSGQLSPEYTPQTRQVAYVATEFVDPARLDYRLKKAQTELKPSADGRLPGFAARP